ncbi:MAG: hypothetical protein VYB24_07550, partial [Pseudomonadota bacterium]|nr:hypothetical protein [Pseudomonadota bacterium]
GPSRDRVAAREREEAERRRRPAREPLTDEERAARLAEFASDGAAHDARRADRLRGHRGNAAREAIADDEYRRQQPWLDCRAADSACGILDMYGALLCRNAVSPAAAAAVVIASVAVSAQRRTRPGFPPRARRTPAIAQAVAMAIIVAIIVAIVGVGAGGVGAVGAALRAGVRVPAQALDPPRHELDVAHAQKARRYAASDGARLAHHAVGVALGPGYGG